MEYTLEELMPLVVKLTKKYTSNESSSIPYDTAKMLMEAVIYTVEECYEDRGNIQMAGRVLAPELAYQYGYEQLVLKVKQAKEIYDRIVDSFEDYHCQNYRDTIIKGMPEYFLNADLKYRPQDHILTLDYPTMNMNFEKQGVNLIFDYLSDIEVEKTFLDLFDCERIEGLLEKIQPEYRSLYLDNICDPVLLTVIGCVISDRPIRTLELNERDCQDIEIYFAGDSKEKIQFKITNLITQITRPLKNPKMQDYLKKAATSYTSRIHFAIKQRAWHSIFFLYK